MFEEHDIIHSYSRQQAIEDGVLVDVTRLAKEAGYNLPVAVTQTVWSKCIAVPPSVPDQDEQGRTWDVLHVLRHVIRKSRPGDRVVHFSVFVQNDKIKPREIKLKSICGPGDNAEPVITILLPHED